MAELLEHRVVSPEEMKLWPVDRARSGEKRWAESTWGTGPLDGDRRLFYNWNTWPCRVVFEVTQAGPVARGEAQWRRSKLSIRMKGLKLISTATGAVITDARVLRYDQGGVEIEFKPVDGPGLYYLYYAAYEDALFTPSEEWLHQASNTKPVEARPLRIEARCSIDDFDAMETIALPLEVDGLLTRFPQSPYLLFPEDRDRPIKMQFDLPAHWAREGPREELVLHADRHEYRVFQLGVYACRAAIPDVAVESSDLIGPGGATLDSKRVQCVTIESRIKSRYVTKPSGPFAVPYGQVRALWFGIDIPQSTAPGEYTGHVLFKPAGLAGQRVPIRLIVSDTVVPERGDHDLHRLARLRWIESDVGLSDRVYPPYKPLRVSGKGRVIKSWGHTITLGANGLPVSIDVGKQRVTAGPMTVTCKVGGKPMAWRGAAYKITAKQPGFVEWESRATERGLTLTVRGRMEYDACSVVTVTLEAAGGKPVKLRDLKLRLPWDVANAWLASGLGYRGRREGGRSWRSMKRGAKSFEPAVWMGSVEAGLGWKTWTVDHWAGLAGAATAATSIVKRDAWEDIARADAITIDEERDAVVLTANLGDHSLEPGATPWSFCFALLPTPVKPPDARHWQFRYMHKGGGFWPSGTDTPQSFLADNCKRLDEVTNDLGVKRLNLHDWWGPAFNYAWQWDGPDNLKRLTEEAHKRGVFVKVYNSGRELSTFAPEFWAILYEGTGYQFRDGVEPSPRLWFQDAWRQNHLPDGIPAGWPRLHEERGDEHCIPVSNATRNGNFYLESMRYMTRFFGTDGAYWDGADGPTLGHREMAKRLWVVFKQNNPNAATDVHHGHAATSSPVADHMLVFPFIDSLWHGEGFEQFTESPWVWLVETAALPFGVPSEMLGMDHHVGRGMLFGTWARHGWYAETDVPKKLWAFFDRFQIHKAEMLGWWRRGGNGVTVDRPETLVTAFRHPRNGLLLVIATWHPPLAAWMEMTFDVSLHLDRKKLGLPAGALKASDILTGEDVDITKPVPIPDMKFGRMIWVRK
ncbi:MAG: DUF6067 family protein [Planctomycetes bacterium]|nr:DUF6067 family protein [Planctomycetota bacterium]